MTAEIAAAGQHIPFAAEVVPMVARRAGVRRCDTFLTLLRRSAARAFGPRHPVRSKVSQIRRSVASDRWMCRHYNRAMMPKAVS